LRLDKSGFTLLGIAYDTLYLVNHPQLALLEKVSNKILSLFVNFPNLSSPGISTPVNLQSPQPYEKIEVDVARSLVRQVSEYVLLG